MLRDDIRIVFFMVGFEKSVFFFFLRELIEDLEVLITYSYWEFSFLYFSLFSFVSCV